MSSPLGASPLEDPRAASRLEDPAFKEELRRLAEKAPARLAELPDGYSPGNLADLAGKDLVDAMIDWKVLHPTGKWVDFAAETGRHVVYIRSIASSDGFKVRLEQALDAHRASLRDAVLTQQLELTTRVASVAGKSLDLLEKKLEEKAGSASLMDVGDITDKLLGKLGFGPRPQGGVNVSISNVNGSDPLAADPAAILAARQRIRQIEQYNALLSPAGEARGATSNTPLGEVPAPSADGEVRLPSPTPAGEARSAPSRDGDYSIEDAAIVEGSDA